MDESSYSHCPNCLADYRPGFDTCADCGIALVHGPAPVTEEHAPPWTRGHRHPTEDRHDLPVVLCQIPQIEAQILTAKLEAAGLVVAADEPPLTAYGLAISGVSGLRVWVLESQLDEAREIAKRSLSGDDAI
ncbi:MAG: hypothetical protein ACRDH7_00025 [Actinomycetota bacterium]